MSHARQVTMLLHMVSYLLSGTLHVDGNCSPPHLEWPGHPVSNSPKDRIGYLAVDTRMTFGFSCSLLSMMHDLGPRVNESAPPENRDCESPFHDESYLDIEIDRFWPID